MLLLFSSFLGHHGWEDELSPPPLHCLSYPFVRAFILSPASTYKLTFLGFKTCPISPYLEWLGVVGKVEEYGSVRCRVLNGSNDSFPFVLGRYTIQRLLFYRHRYFRFFFPNCSYTVFALSSRGTLNMPMTESSSAVSQDCLDFYYPSSATPFLSSGLGPQCKNGSGSQIIEPYNYYYHQFILNFESFLFQLTTWNI